jgi:hypothetical protein
LMWLATEMACARTADIGAPCGEDRELLWVGLLNRELLPPVPALLLTPYFHRKKATDIRFTTWAFIHHMHAIVPARMLESSSLFQ